MDWLASLCSFLALRTFLYPLATSPLSLTSLTTNDKFSYWLADLPCIVSLLPSGYLTFFPFDFFPLFDPFLFDLLLLWLVDWNGRLIEFWCVFVANVCDYKCLDDLFFWCSDFVWVWASLWFCTDVEDLFCVLVLNLSKDLLELTEGTCGCLVGLANADWSCPFLYFCI